MNYCFAIFVYNYKILIMDGASACIETHAPLAVPPPWYVTYALSQLSTIQSDPHATSYAAYALCMFYYLGCNHARHAAHNAVRRGHEQRRSSVGSGRVRWLCLA